MPNDGPSLIDLTAFVAASTSNPKYGVLAKLVRYAYSMASVRMDLHHALAMMNLVASQQASLKAEAQTDGGLTQDRALAASGLFVTALLLYTRSVHSKGSDRSTLNLSNRLELSLRVHHDRMVELRNCHFAHYATGDKWEDWRVLAVIRDHDVAISYPNDRRFLRANDAYALHELLKAVQPLSAKSYEKATQRLITEIYRLMADDEDFADVARRFKFEPATFFSPAELQGFYQSLGGETAFWHSPQYQAEFKEGDAGQGE